MAEASEAVLYKREDEQKAGKDHQTDRITRFLLESKIGRQTYRTRPSGGISWARTMNSPIIPQTRLNTPQVRHTHPGLV